MEHSAGGFKKYRVPRDGEGNQVDIEVHVPSLRAENLNLQTWGSSYILAGQLHRLNVNPRSFDKGGIEVLELGAGTGLVGLSAATIWKANVILTDLAAIVPGLSKNIEANRRLLAASNSSASCGTLDWSHPSKLSIKVEGEGRDPRALSNDTDKATVILAADTIYSEEHPRMLTDAIFAWLKPGKHARAIIAYPLRVAYLDAIRELWERLEGGGVVAIDEGRAETGDEWDDERCHEWSVWRWRDTPEEDPSG